MDEERQKTAEAERSTTVQSSAPPPSPAHDFSPAGSMVMPTDSPIPLEATKYSGFLEAGIPATEDCGENRGDDAVMQEQVETKIEVLEQGIEEELKEKINGEEKEEISENKYEKIRDKVKEEIMVKMETEMAQEINGEIIIKAKQEMKENKIHEMEDIVTEEITKEQVEEVLKEKREKEQPRPT